MNYRQTLNLILTAFIALHSVANTSGHSDEIDSYALLSKKQIIIGRNVHVLSGDLGTNKKNRDSIIIRKNSTTSEQSTLRGNSIRLNRDVTIGSIEYNNLIKKQNVTISGSITPTLNLPLVHHFPKISHFHTGKTDILIPRNSEKILSSGKYSDIVIGKNAIVTFNPGYYFIKSLNIRKSAKLKFNGTTKLFIKKALRMGKNVAFNIEDSVENISILYAGHGQLNIGSQNHLIVAQIIAPKAEVKIGRSSIFTGRIIADKIKIRKDSTIQNGDMTPPIIVADPPGGSYNDSITVRLSANESAAIFYTNDGSEPTPSSTRFTTPIIIDTDTVLKFIGIDTSGNQSNVQTENYTFGINPPPVITITGIGDGDFRNNDVIPIITITDTDLLSSNITLNNVPFTSGTPITADETYALNVDAVDAAGNTSAAAIAFTIDKTPPTIIISNVSDGQITGQNITPMITVNDLNLNTVTILLNNQPYTSGTPIISEGTYTLSVTANDLADNTSIAMINFIIDTSFDSLNLPPNIVLECPTDTDPSSTGAAMANDQCGILQLSFTDQATPNCGNAQVITRTWTATDNCGNTTSADQIITVNDTTPPTLQNVPSNLTVECDAVPAPANVTATDHCDDNLIVDFIESTSPALPQTITRTWTATDACGNTQMATQLITITDTTAPVLTLNGAPTETIECTTPYVESGASASDNCDGDITSLIVINNTTVNPSSPGIYVVTYDVVDASGNTAIQLTRTVNVADTTPPIISLTGANPQFIECSNSYAELGATATDQCDGDITPSITINATGVDTTTPGTYSVTYDVADANGNNAAQVTRTVNVVDATAPIITLSGNNPQTIECSTPYTELGVVANDNCNGDLSGSVIIDAANVNTSTPGAYTVTYNVTDTNGNIAIEAVRTVNVADVTAPVISLTGANPQFIECSSPYIELGATATDQCSGDLTATITINATGVDTTTPGAYSITYDVADANGNNAAQVTRTVNVVDVTAPIITVSGENPQTIECSTPYTELGVVANDNCNGDLSGSVIIDAANVNTSTPGAYTVTYNVTDANGNVAIEAVRTVNLVDATPPVISLTGANPQIIECSSPYTELGATATDQCSGDLTATITINATGVDTTTPGAYSVTYDVADANGNNAAQVTRTVNVVDVTAPIITLSGNNPQTIECSTPYTELGVVANDNCDGDLSGSVIIDAANVNTATPGAYTVTYNVMDTDGNVAAEVVRTVDVADATPPIIALTGANPQIIECSNSYAELGATATDLCDGDITSAITIDPATVDTTTPGAYSVTYDVIDANGNNASQVTRTVNIVDVTAPIITLSGNNPQTIECSTPYTELGVVANDNCDGDLSGSVIIDAADVNTATPGAYTVTYNVTDANGNVATETVRTVNVVDTTPPVISLTGANPQIIECSSPYAELGATASDQCSGDITPSITINAAGVDTTTPGTYAVTYDVIDANGNAAAQVSRTVTVTDTTAPVITLNGNALQTIQCSSPYTEAGATATDLCDGDLTPAIVVNNNTVNTGLPGIYFVTYDVTDSAGNAATQITRIVTVEDTTSPEITLLGANPQIIECSTPYTELGAVASDSCDGDATSGIMIDASSVNTTSPGSYSVTYNLTDSNGNTAAQQIRTVTVVDTTPPVITLLGDNPLTIECSTPYTEAGANASDLCDGNVTAAIIINSTNVDPTNPGTYTVTYTVSDSNGNNATEVLRTVHVVDTVAPTISLIEANPQTIECTDNYIELGVTATDTCAGDLTNTIIINSSAVDISNPGSYMVFYNVVDASGNNAIEIIRTVNVIDTTSPLITVAGVVDSQITTTSVTPQITISDCSLDASSITLNTLPYTSGNPITDDGRYDLNVNAADNSGNSSSIAISFAIDTTPPEITVLSPVDNSIVNELDITITGTVTDLTLTSLTINNEIVTLNGDAFVHIITLPDDGANTITLSATDAVNLNTTQEITVIRDTPNLTTRSNGSLSVSAATNTTSDPAITLIGTADPNTQVRIEGGQSVIVGTVQSNGQFSVLVPLVANRINKLFVTNFDNNGDIGSPISIDITQDSQAPFLFIDFPEDGAQLTNDTITVAGRIGDTLSGFLGLDVTVNSNPAQVIVGIGTNGTFERQNVPLSLGSNTITATALDIHGNTITKEIMVDKVAITGPTMAVESGNLQTAPVNTTLTNPIQAKLTFTNGLPIVNKVVTFNVIRSNGRLAATQLTTDTGELMLQTKTDVNGIATAYWTLGSDAGCGNNRIQITSKDISGTIFFCASATPGPPKQINISAGNDQRAATNALAPEPLRIWVSDGCNGVANIPVTFTIVKGGGNFDGLTSTTVNTSVTGHTQVDYALGSNPGNNIIEASFQDNPVLPAAFIITGVPADINQSASFIGVVEDNAGQAIGGAECTLEISGTTLPSVFSAGNGQFTFTNIPAGPGHLHVNGRIATTVGGNAVSPGSFPELSYEILTIPNAVNELPTPVLLPPLNPNNGRIYDGTQDVELTLEGLEGLKFIVKAGSMRRADGTTPTPGNPETLSINRVNIDKIPMPMPDGAFPPFAWTFQPGGATYDPPVQIEVPNTSGLPAGSITNILSFNHDTNRFEIVASGHVIDDGSAIISDTNSGISTAGWGGICPPYSTTGSVRGPLPNSPPPTPPPAPPIPPFGIGEHGEDRSVCSANGGGPPTSPPGVSAGSGSNSFKILVHSGEEHYEHTDLTIAGRGMHWMQKRVYRSRLIVETPMGFGWSHPYYDYLIVNLNGSIRSFGGSSPGNTSRFDDWLVDLANPNKYIPPKAIFSTLTRDENATSLDLDDDRFIMIDRIGNRREYQMSTESIAMLRVIEDKYGNQLRLYYEDQGRPTLVTRINDTLGRDILYQYYPPNDGNPGRRDKLAKITDFTGRELNYDYDQNGDLIECISPVKTGTVTNNNFPDGKRTTYTYTSGFDELSLNHNLNSVIFPNENDSRFGLPNDSTPALQWTYDDQDRVKTHTVGTDLGTGAAGGTIHYDYEENPQSPSDFDANLEETANLKVTETDRNGNIRHYWINDFGTLTRFEHFTKGLRNNEPEKYMKRYKLNNDNLNTIVENPEGDRWQMTFDSTNLDLRQRGNLLQSIHIPDDRGGDQIELEQQFVYDPFYNQPCLRIDARAYAASFTPQNGGVVSPIRYATQYIFDYQEGPDNDTHKQRLADKFGLTLQQVKDIIDFNESQIEQALGLAVGSVTVLGRGDLNGDGRTDQINGNHVVLIQPNVALLPGSNQAIAEGDVVQEIKTAFAYDDNGLLQYTIDPVGNVSDYSYFPSTDPNGDGNTNDVTELRSGNGYLQSTIEDDRELPAVTQRLATADSIPFASLTTQYQRDPVGNLTALTDPRGNTRTMAYNELNQIIRVIEPAPYSYTTDTIYDANNNIVQTIKENKIPDLIDFKPQFDINNNIVLTDGTPNNFVQSYTYDILNKLLITDIDATDSIPNRLITLYQYDANENLKLVTKPQGNQVQTIFDERDLPLTVTIGFGSADASTTTYNYDNNSNLVKVIDAEDNNSDGQPEPIIYQYDGFDRLKRKIDAVGNVDEIIYDPIANVIDTKSFGAVGGPSPADNQGLLNTLLQHTITQYDELNRAYQTDRWLNVASGTSLNRAPLLIDGPLSPAVNGFVSSRTEFDAANRITFTVEDDLDTTSFVYDGLNRRLRITDAEQNTIEYVYDGNDNILTTTETDVSQLNTIANEIIITTNNYDVLNRLTKTVDNIGNTDRFGYDSRDNQTIHLDAIENTKLFVFDGANRRLAEHSVLRIDGTGNTGMDLTQSDDGFISVFYTWDGNSRLQALMDDNGNRTIYSYDELDRKISATYGDIVDPPALADVQDPVTIESWTYDKDFNTTTFTDQNQSIHVYSYDGINRRTQCDITVATGNPHNLTGTTKQTWEYDGLNRNTICTDNNNPTSQTDDVMCTYGYDTLSRKIEEASRIGSLPVRITSFKFDESSPDAGNLDPTAMIYPDGREVEYHYDSINRLNQLNDLNHSPLTTYSFIGRNPRVLEKNYQNNTKRIIEYDGIRRPTRLETVDSFSQTVIGFEHSYDGENNKLNERKLHDLGNSELYAYDSAYRLIDFGRGTLNAGGSTVTAPTPTTDALQNRDWILDGVGNWQQNDVLQEGTILQTKTRQHTNFNEIATDAGTSLDHDDNGNQVENGTQHYTWDALNRLRTVTRISDNAMIAEYTYDCQNRRHSKKLTTGNGSLITHYYYSGWRVCEEYDFDGVNESIKYQYVWGAVYHDELVVRDDRQNGITVSELNNGIGSDRQFQHHNTLFSVFAVTDETGVVLERYQYAPYGNQTIMDATLNQLAQSSIEGEFTYTGQRFDAETSLYYYKNRYYSSELGRFISRDPIGYKGGINLYSYVNNRPLYWTDEYGLRGGNSGRNPRRSRGTGATQPDYTGLALARGEFMALRERFQESVRRINDPILRRELRLGFSESTTPILHRPGNNPIARVNNQIRMWNTYSNSVRRLLDRVNTAVLNQGGSGIHDSSRPPNLSPPGAGRHGALREARRRSGIPMRLRPTRVLPSRDRDGNIIPGRTYIFDLPGRRVIIREDAAGDFYEVGNPQNRGPHFNFGDNNHCDY